MVAKHGIMYDVYIMYMAMFFIIGVMYNRDTGSDGCDYRGNLPESDCRFRDEDGVIGRYGSLMYKPALPHVSYSHI